MNRVFVLIAGVCAVLSASTALAQRPATVPRPFLIMSQPGTHQSCPNACEIVVRITKDGSDNCEAHIDVETVHVKKNKKFKFVLSQSPEDTNVYAFVRDGLAWVDSSGNSVPPPDPSEFAPDKPHGKGFVKWKTGNSPTPEPYHYAPVVSGPNGNCKSADPKIANEN